MLDFFKDLFEKLHVLTGVDMTFLTDDEKSLLLLQLVQCGQQDPFHHIADEVKQRIIMENMYTDESMVKPPYGVRPGLNRRILTKWYNKHWQLYGNTIAQKNESTTDDDQYKKYVTWATAEGLPVLPKDQYATPEKVKEYVKQIGVHMLSKEKPEAHAQKFEAIQNLLTTVEDVGTAMELKPAYIRMLQRYYLRQNFNYLNLQKIAELTGITHHTSVIHSIEAVEHEPHFNLAKKEIESVLVCNVVD